MFRRSLWLWLERWELRLGFIPRWEPCEEWLERSREATPEVTTSLDDLWRAHRWLGGTSIYRTALLRRILPRYRARRLTILDVACGRADLTQWVVRLLRAHGVHAWAVGVDINRPIVREARRRWTRGTHADVVVLEGDAFHLPFRDDSFDLVMSSLFLHHCGSRSRQFLAECLRVARIAVIVHDIIRHRIPLWFARFVLPCVVRSPITRHDAQASFRRAWTIAEAVRMAPLEHVQTIDFWRNWAFRFGLILWKSMPLTQSSWVVDPPGP